MTGCKVIGHARKSFFSGVRLVADVPSTKERLTQDEVERIRL